MKSSNLMVPTTPKYQWSPLVVPQMSFMSHNNGMVNWIKLVSKLKFKESFLDDDGNLGGMNHTLFNNPNSTFHHIFCYGTMCHLYIKL